MALVEQLAAGGQLLAALLLAYTALMLRDAAIRLIEFAALLRRARADDPGPPGS